MANSRELKDLKNKLESGEYSLKDVAGKSDIWTRFKQIVFTESGKTTGFVQCEKCLNIFSYESSKTGSSHLKRHNCSKKSSPKLTSFLKPENQTVNKNDKQIVLEAAVKMCCKDLRPFDFVSGEGFANFAQTLINMGAKYGSISVSEIIPHATTISRHVSEIAENMRNELISILNKKIKDGVCAASTDMWTDDYRKRSYTSVTVHYFDDEWNLVSKLLFTCDFPEERKTGMNIRKELNHRFTKLGLHNDCLEKIVFVTDRGANIINALEPFKRLDCIAHIINTVLRNLFKTDVLKEKNIAVFETLTSAKALVTYLKQSGLVNRLTKSVHQDSETRWNSKLEMLSSVQEMYDEIVEILSERGERNRLDNIHSEVLSGLINFLSPFKEASLTLEKEDEITLPYVLLWYKKLLSKCEADPKEKNFMSDLKSRATDLIKEKFIIREEHKLATFLCPSFRQLKMITTSEKEDFMKNIKSLIAEMECDSSLSPVPSTSEPEVKKAKFDADFSEWEDEESHVMKNEIDIYYSLAAPSSVKDLNMWWKKHQLQLKQLSKLAKKILCIPATSASCERNFSAAGYLINERRTRLNPEIIDASLFLHNNL